MKTKQMTKIKITKGEQISDSIISPNDHEIVHSTWFPPQYTLFVEDCGNIQDADNFTNSDIELYLTLIDNVYFWVMNVKNLRLIIDSPVGRKFKGEIDSMNAIFLDNSHTVRSIRAVKFIDETKEHLNNLLSSMREWSKEEYEEIIEGIYKKYPTSESMLGHTVMAIKWNKSILH